MDFDKIYAELVRIAQVARLRPSGSYSVFYICPNSLANVVIAIFIYNLLIQQAHVNWIFSPFSHADRCSRSGPRQQSVSRSSFKTTVVYPRTQTIQTATPSLSMRQRSYRLGRAARLAPMRRQPSRCRRGRLQRLLRSSREPCSSHSRCCYSFVLLFRWRLLRLWVLSRLAFGSVAGLLSLPSRRDLCFQLVPLYGGWGCDGIHNLGELRSEERYTRSERTMPGLQAAEKRCLGRSWNVRSSATVVRPRMLEVGWAMYA